MIYIQTNENSRLITCILTKGEDLQIIKTLKDEKNICAANVAGGRGGGKRGRLEVDIITIVVESDRADEIFDFIHDKARIGEYHSGFMYQGKLTRSTVFTLPKAPSEDK